MPNSRAASTMRIVPVQSTCSTPAAPQQYPSSLTPRTEASHPSLALVAQRAQRTRGVPRQARATAPGAGQHGDRATHLPGEEGVGQAPLRGCKASGHHNGIHARVDGCAQGAHVIEHIEAHLRQQSTWP